MPRITYTVEKIIDKFRETEVVLAKGQTVVCTASSNTAGDRVPKELCGAPR
jgi:hypothetical protein